jgi:hypothetical protein
MPARTGKCILAKDIKLDKSYTEVLAYSESSMLSLVNSKAIASTTNCSFIRQDENVIDVPVPYGTALQANYMAFQNPDYSNKWFFAFVDEVKYVSDGTTRITFIVDEFSTWFDYWNVQPCFVIREHVNDDTVGLHTIPEGLEHGDYISNGFQQDTRLKNIGYILQASEDYDDNQNQMATYICGLYNAGRFWYFHDDTAGILEFLDCIQQYDRAGKGDAIQNVYVVPDEIIDDKPATGSLGRWGGMQNPHTYIIEVDKQTTIDGYTPRNNKLLTQEYNFLVLDNNNGSSNKLAYEYFSDAKATFEVAGVPSCGCSIKCYPKNYKGESNYQQEGIACGKFPTCGWVNDPYTNWLTQNSVNIATGHIAQGAKILGGIAESTFGGNPEGGASMIGEGLGMMFNEFQQKYEHDILPHTASGNINCGDINTCYKMNTFYFIKMSIRAEYARSIDDWFDRFGYKINRVKTPNISGRTYWNYVQIGNNECIGYSNKPISVPPKSMDIINQIFRKGTTVWHSHDNIGNYALENTIV